MCLCLILMCSACVAAFCQEKRFMAETDVCGLAGGKAGLGFEYGISGHWSAGWTVGFGFAHFIKDASKLESEHRQEFGDIISKPSPPDLHREGLHVKYWPAETMKGPYAKVGITHGSASGTDLRIGTGYVMNIWKSLNLYIEYSIGLKETIGKEAFPVRGLAAGITLTFGKRP